MFIMGKFSREVRKAGVWLCLAGALAVLTGCGQEGGEEISSSIVTESTTVSTSATAAPTEPTTAPVTGEGYCAVDSMNVRGGPGTDYFAIGGLKYGEKVEILGKEGDWYKIAFKDDVGYVSAQYIQASPPPEGGTVTSGTTSATTQTTSGE